MTTTEKLCRASRWRIREPNILASQDSAGWNGAFLVPVNGMLWHVMIEETADWRHLSAVSSIDIFHTPDHAVMKRLRDLFFDDEATVIEFYRNFSDGHLWEYMDALPTPPAPEKHAY